MSKEDSTRPTININNLKWRTKWVPACENCRGLYEYIKKLERKDMKFISSLDILSIKQEDLPFPVLSFNTRSVIATLINIRRKSNFNHFMWMHRPGHLATQDVWYREVRVEKYLKNHHLKLWHNPNWTAKERAEIKLNIHKWLEKPKFTTRYDFLAILGQLIGMGHLIQNPLTRICSDYGAFLKIVDPRYNLKYPAPDQVDEWMSSISGYEVYARYSPD